MGTLIELGIGLALVTALAFGVHKWWDGFKEGIAAPYVQAQIAADQPKIDKANANAVESDKRATNAQSDTQACKEASAVQSGKVKEWEDIAKSNAARVKSLLAAGAKLDQTRQADIERFQLIATSKDVKAQTCEQQLAEVDKLARDRARAVAAAARLKAGASK